MRMIRLGLLTLGACLWTAPTTRAGIYNTEPLEQLPGPLPYAQFQKVFGDCLRVTAPGTPEHRHYLARIKELEAKGQGPFGLTLDDRINLSSFYLRLQEPDKAARILSAVEGEGNFMVLANLATAHQLAGRMERAADAAESALKRWPSTWPGWTQGQLSWFYRVEKHYLALLRARSREERVQPGKAAETLDDLFPGVRFVGPSGRYEAGRIDPIQYARLPADNLAIVGQMLVWLPTDPRLYWLFGELLNANGFIPDAAVTLDSLAFTRGFLPKDLKEHLHVLKEARPIAAAWATTMMPTDEYFRLLWMLSPRGGAAPVSSPVATVCDYAVALSLMRRPARQDEPEPRTAANPTTRSGNAAGMPDVRNVAVSFLAGVALTVLAGMQIREMRRRRQTAARPPVT